MSTMPEFTSLICGFTALAANLCPHCIQPTTSVLVADWSFNGTTDEVSPSQMGKATILNPSASTALKFDDAAPIADHVKQGFIQVRAPAYLNIPAVTFIQDSSFTMSWDMRIPNWPTKRTMLLTNWKSGMWQFLTYYDPDGKVGCQLRRNMDTDGSNPEQGLVDVSTITALPLGVWRNITFTFDRTKRTLYVYVDGKKSNESVVRSSVTDLSLHTSNSTQFQFGFKADENNPNGVMNADIRNLRFFRLYTNPV
ncbi:concanavalin A-like lectin/glucanase domain-containing protein [Panaeolus papilionaceus]|nr:concanavalin A-like lectin/glucanase domain-containing protein [Panaeolus papilionaceus]